MSLTKFASTLALLLVIASTFAARVSGAALQSFDTGHTITRVRTVQYDGETAILASTYDGKLIAMQFDGEVLWENDLSGYMNHDLWCADLTGDGRDEVLAANADGAVYCLDDRGELKWKHQPSEAPMYSVCALPHEGKTLVACGGYDKNLYYLSAAGKRIKTVPSADYAVMKGWGRPDEKRYPTEKEHLSNFIRPLRDKNGKSILAVHGVIHSMATTGALYFFKPLEDKPYQTINRVDGKTPYGDLSVCDIDSDGADELVMGTSTLINGVCFNHIDPEGPKQRVFDLFAILKKREVDWFGYRVAQTVVIGPADDRQFLTSFGSSFVLAPVDFDPAATADVGETLRCGFSFNDFWKDPSSDRVLMASAQSGGSCVHVLDTADPDWKQAYLDFSPTGNLKKLIDNAEDARERLSQFSPPKRQGPSRKVHFLTEKLVGKVRENAHSLEEEYGNPVFFHSKSLPGAEKWDREGIPNEAYRNRRDGRMKYVLSQEEVLDKLLPLYDEGRQGIAFWGGHGNDPYLFSPDTLRKVIDASGDQSTVFIFPELEDYTEEMKQVLDHHIYPLAEYIRDKGGRLYVRTKHTFWHGIVHLPMWSRLMSGEFADVFIPSMEETTDKSMEQTIAARLGVWASGAVDQWGSRCARDNQSFDRLRQHGHQMKPSHFLRNQVYHIANGATYQNNFPVDQEYFSFLYELIAKGALYVPKRSEILSFSPVHLSITNPDKRFIEEGNNTKWVTFFDEQTERDNPLVFSRLNGSWPGAPVTEWDFSRYAAGVKDRRLHFLPPYENGMVMITPVQNGPMADKDAPRGKLEDHLHPIYRGKMMEFITDGRHYLTPKGDKKYAADKAYKTVEKRIQQGAKLLPLTVSGGVAWVTAQTSPTHLRLTLIDGGYLNPSDKTALVDFHSVRPKKIVDLLDKKTYEAGATGRVEIDVPCGLFRFIDIELTEPLPQGRSQG